MLIVQKQLNDKEKRFFEYLLALSSLNHKTVRSIQDYEKVWAFDELAEIDGCTIGNQCGQPSNLLEIHKPTLKHTVLVCPRPYPELVKWSNFKLNKQSGIASIQNHKKIEEIFKESKNNKNDQQLSEWKEWATKKRRFDRANHFYAELLEIFNQWEQESDGIELVLSKGLLKWGGIADGEDIELPLFTTKVLISKNAKTDMIVLTEETKGLKFEEDLLDELPIPNNDDLKAFIKKIENTNFTAELTEEWKKLAKLLNPNGRFIENEGGLYGKNIPVIIDQSYLIVRQNNHKLLKGDLKQIIKAIDQESLELPNSIRNILGNASKTKSQKVNFLQSTLANQLYFPLSSSEQQKEIAKRVEKNHSVTVQIAPNTDETVAVANLVSHYLTEGKRVLITTQKDSPLSGLKKQLPKEIRDLCVPLLDDESSDQEIEQSLQVIADKTETLNIQELKEKVRRNQQLLQQSVQNEEICKKVLKQYAKSEGTPILHDNRPLFKYDIAKRLAETNVAYQWLKDELPLIMKFPLSSEEWTEFCTIQNSLTKEDALLLHINLPSIQNNLLSKPAFRTLVEEEEKISKDIDTDYILPIEDVLSKKSTLLIMKDIVEEIIETRHVIEDEVYTTFIRDLLSTEKRKEYWVQLIDEIVQNNQKASSLYADLIHERIILPKKLMSEIYYDLEIARERILSGKKPNPFFFIGKGKSTKYLFQTAVLNGRPLRKLEDIITLEKYLEYKGLITKLARLFNQNMSEVGIPEIDITAQEFPQLMEERMAILEKIIDIVELNAALSAKLQIEGLQLGDLFDEVFYGNLSVKIDHTLNYIKFTKWQQTYEEEIEKLENLTQIENIHPITHQFLTALQEKDFETWQILLRNLKELHQKIPTIDKWRKHADKLAEKLPSTVEYITHHFGEVKLEPTFYQEAFTLKKMETWLKEDGDINSRSLKKQLQYERKAQKNLIQKIIKDATWAFQLERLTDEEKSVLKDWKFYRKKIGSGKGRHAFKFIEGARESLKKAQSTIPVWIMPIQQVLQTFPIESEKFDLIIIDGSVQYDLSTLNVLVRGEKTIILGKETSAPPSTIDINRDVVAGLIHRYIQDVPNNSLYDGGISIFKIGEQSFPQGSKLTLQDDDQSIPKNIPFVREQLPLRAEQLEPQCESIFEIDVLKWILSKGYYVIPQFEVGNYKIDFVIEGLRERLAVECDGEKWQGTKKYEENLLKQEALEKAGWVFWPVSGKDFYADQEKTMEGLWAALSKLGIYPIGEEENEKVLHDFHLNVKHEQEPSIQFQIQTKKPHSSGAREKIKELSDPQKHVIQRDTLKEEAILNKAFATETEDLSKIPAVILTNKNKESKIFSISNLNDIPSELIQNVVIQGKTSVVQFLQDLGFEIVDYRLQDGSLWVVANEDIKPFMEKLEACNVSFRFVSKGSQTTKGNPAWYTKIVE